MVTIIREVNASYIRKKGKRRVKCTCMWLKLAGTQESCLFSEVESCDPIKAFLDLFRVGGPVGVEWSVATGNRDSLQRSCSCLCTGTVPGRAMLLKLYCAS